MGIYGRLTTLPSASLILYDCTPLGLVIVAGNHLELLLLLKSRDHLAEKHRIMFFCQMTWSAFPVAVASCPGCLELRSPSLIVVFVSTTILHEQHL